MPADAPELDPPDPDRVYRNYVESCRRFGVEPVPYERARELVAEWAKAIADSAAPPTKH